MVRHKHVRTTAMTIALTRAACGAQAAGKGPHWEYTGHHGGPKQWAELDTAFEAYAKGVSWMVLKAPVTLDADQIKAFRRV